MKIEVYNQKGKKTQNTVELADNVFGAEINEGLMSQAIYTYLSNQRRGTQKTKGIGEVSGGGVKPWKQKTPDKARQGSRRSPIWVGGGRAHPIIPKEWRLKIPLKMKRAAIFSALSEKVSEKVLRVVDNVKFSDEKLTNQAEEFYKAMIKDGKLLVITNEKENNLFLGSKSLPQIRVIRSGELNIYDIFNSEMIVILEDAVEKINAMWGVEKKSSDKKESK